MNTEMTTSVAYDRYEDILRGYLPHAKGAPLTAESDLAELGLDSLGTVQLLAELEAEFDVELPDEVLTIETFASAGALWAALLAGLDQ